MWINKGSVSNHLKSERHVNSLEARKIQESITKTVEHSMQDEAAMEEEMNFTIFSTTIQPKIAANIPAPQCSEEEQRIWDHFALGDNVFHAGIDHTLSATEERTRLEREAAEFDLWHGGDFLLDTDPIGDQLLLHELENDEITSELLRNACKFRDIIVFIVLSVFYRFRCP